jgi:hypothetical protein
MKLNSCQPASFMPLQAVSTDHAGTVCVWHVASGKLRFAFANTHGSCRISTASFDSNHRRLITGGAQLLVRRTCMGQLPAITAELPSQCGGYFSKIGR